MNLGGGMKMNGCLCKFFIMSILRVLKWRMKLYCVDDVQKKWTIWWIGERCRAPYACSVQFDVRYSARLGFKSKPSIGEMDDRMEHPTHRSTQSVLYSICQYPPLH